MAVFKTPDINKVMISGNVVSPPEVKLVDGIENATFVISSGRKYRDKSGTVRETLCYLQVFVENELVESVKTLKETTALLIEGDLINSDVSSEKEGSTRTLAELRAVKIQVLDKQTLVSETESPVEKETNTDTVKVNEDDTVKVPPTDFDFGYQDLKI